MIVAVWLALLAALVGAAHHRNSHVVFKRLSPIEIDENAPIGQFIIDLKVRSLILFKSGTLLLYKKI